MLKDKKSDGKLGYYLEGNDGDEGNGDRYRFPPFPYISIGRNRFHLPPTRGKQAIWPGFAPSTSCF